MMTEIAKNINETPIELFDLHSMIAPIKKLNFFMEITNINVFEGIHA
jgi:hypothetical protein